MYSFTHSPTETAPPMRCIRACQQHCAPFRSAVITAFYEETGASDTQMGVLAQLMCHDVETARTVYYRPKMAKAAVDTSDRMLAVLDLTGRSPEIVVK